MSTVDWLPGPLRDIGLDEHSLTPGRFLAALAKHHGDRDALVFEDGHISYRELYARCRAVARALLAAGAGKGTAVALLVGNRPEFVVGLHAVGMVGGVAVPMSTLAAAAERDYVLAHCDAGILLAQYRLGRREPAAELLADHPDAVRSAGFPHLRAIVGVGPGELPGVTGWAEFLAGGEAIDDELLDAVVAAAHPSDTGVIIYTSGTTSHPKAVVHRQRTPIVQHGRWAEQLRLAPHDRVWSPFPFFWTAGYTMAMGSTLAAGAALVLQELPDPAGSLALFERERVTTVHAWPQLDSQLAEHPDAATRDLSGLRKLPRGSALRAVAGQVDEDWGTVGAYGLTETFTINTCVPADSPVELREGTHGVALPGIALRIVDPDTGSPLGTDVVGEIAVKGITLMAGYYKVAPEEYLDADGYFRTGDSGWLDAAGYLHWAGRLSGLIKTHGANVSPVEIEDKLLDWGRLRRASVVGVPHPVLGEAVVLCAVPHDESTTVDELLAHLRARLASYKVPRQVFFVTDDDLRFTGSQKVQLGYARKLGARRVAAIDPEWAQYLTDKHPDLLDEPEPESVHESWRSDDPA